MKGYIRIDLNTRHDKTSYYLRNHVWETIENRDEVLSFETRGFILGMLADVTVVGNKVVKCRLDANKMVELFLSTLEIIK